MRGPQKLPSKFHPCCVACHAQCQPLLSSWYKSSAVQLWATHSIHTHSFACWSIQSIIHSVSCSLYSLINLLVHLIVCLFVCLLISSINPSLHPATHPIHQSMYPSCLQDSSEESTDNFYETSENGESCHVMMQRQGDQSSRPHKCAGGAVCQRALLCRHQRPHSAAGAVGREGSFLPREGCWNVLLLALDSCNCKCPSPMLCSNLSMLCSNHWCFVHAVQQL